MLVLQVNVRGKSSHGIGKVEHDDCTVDSPLLLV